MPKLGWVIPKLFLGSLYQHQKGRQSLLLHTPIFIAEHVNFVATQEMQVDENECPVT